MGKLLGNLSLQNALELVACQLNLNWWSYQRSCQVLRKFSRRLTKKGAISYWCRSRMPPALSHTNLKKATPKFDFSPPPQRGKIFHRGISFEMLLNINLSLR